MAYNVSALTDYVNQTQDELMAKTVLGSRTFDYVTLQAGIKSSASLNTFDNSFTLQDGSSCGFNAAGTVTFGQRLLTVKEITVQEELCPKALQAKYTQFYLKPGKNEDLPFEKIFTDDLSAQIASKNEKALWQGDTGSGSDDLNKFDGFLKVINATAGSYVTGNTIAATGLTSANVINVINAVYTAIPFEIIDKPDFKIFVGYDVFRLYVQALLAANNFHYDGKASDWKIVIPGTTVEVVALQGLNGTNKIVGARTSNLFVGTDLENEEDKIDIWFSKDDQVIKLDVDYKLGVQVKFPSEIVFFKLN